MKMRKLASVVAGVVLTVAMSITAFAAPSPSVAGNVSSGDPEVTVVESSQPLSTEEITTLLGSDYTVVGVVDVTTTKQLPATLTFSVAGVDANDTVGVLHWNGSEWEVVPQATAGNGTISAYFTSLSPVAFLVQDGGSASASTGTSPKTGEMPVAAYGVVAVLALCGVYVLVRKNRA